MSEQRKNSENWFDDQDETAGVDGEHQSDGATDAPQEDAPDTVEPAESVDSDELPSVDGLESDDVTDGAAQGDDTAFGSDSDLPDISDGNGDGYDPIAEHDNMSHDDAFSPDDESDTSPAVGIDHLDDDVDGDATEALPEINLDDAAGAPTDATPVYDAQDVGDVDVDEYGNATLSEDLVEDSDTNEDTVDGEFDDTVPSVNATDEPEDGYHDSDPAFSDYDDEADYGTEPIDVIADDEDTDTAPTEAISATAAAGLTRREIRERERAKESPKDFHKDLGLDKLADDEDDTQKNKKSGKGGVIALWIVGILIVGVIAFLAFTWRPWEPDVTTVPEASETIPMGEVFKDECDRFEGVNCGVILETSEEQPRGGLISQSIEPGTEVELGTRIDLVYSNGPETSEFPNLRNDTVEEAEEMLYNMNVTVNEIEEVDDTGLEPGRVVEASIEAGETVYNGDEVSLQISSGTVNIPDWTGESRDLVSAEADDIGVEVEFIEEESDEAAGVVLEQTPEAGEANTAQVTVTVATPREEIELEVPDIIDLTADEARSELAAEGFRQIKTVTVTNSQVSEEVVTQVVPAVGETGGSDDNVVVIVSQPEGSDDDE